MPCSVRGVASASISSCLMFMPTTGVAIGAGDSATTWTVSVTARGTQRDFLLDHPAERNDGRPG